jgi:hypothetical protein
MFGWEYVIDDLILGKSGSEMWPFEGHAGEEAMKAARKWLDSVERVARREHAKVNVSASGSSHTVLTFEKP